MAWEMDDNDRAAHQAVLDVRGRISGLDRDQLDHLFREARTVNGWDGRGVSDAQIEAIFDLVKMAPTSANCCPARFVILRSAEAKERLRPALLRGNVDKTMAAPAAIIVAYDLAFHEQLPFLFPHDENAASWFTSDENLARETAFRNGSLQGAYLIMAARALGLDCGPMSGFDNAAVDAEFFAATQIKSNFICNIGYGDPESVFKRSPRFDFDQWCEVL